MPKPQTDADPILLTEHEAAALLRISVNHLRDLVREGTLPSPRLRGNRCTRHSYVALRRWADDPRTPAARNRASERAAAELESVGI